MRDIHSHSQSTSSIRILSVPATATEAAEAFLIVLEANVNFANGQDQHITKAGSPEGVVLTAAHASLPIPKYILPDPKGYSAGQPAAPGLDTAARR